VVGFGSDTTGQVEERRMTQCRVDRAKGAAIWAVVFFAAPGAVAGDQPFFTGIGGLSTSRVLSHAYGLSADGTTVVGSSVSASSGNGQEPFRWTASTGMVGLGFLPGDGVGGEAYGVSADGAVVVGRSSSGFNPPPYTSRAFRWSATEGMLGLGALPGQDASEAKAVSADGSVVVGRSSSNTTPEQAFRWTSGTGMHNLGMLPNGRPGTGASGVSADGSVVVGSATTVDGLEAFWWTAETGMVGIGDFSPTVSQYSSASAVSADGSVIVGGGSHLNGPEAFRWTAESGMVGLGWLPGGVIPQSYALGVSGDGRIVVGDSLTARGNEAFVWDEAHGMRNLRSVLIGAGIDLSAWPLLFDVVGVSSDGLTFAGTGRHEYSPGQFRGEAFIAHLPEPASWLIFVLMGAGMARQRRG